MAENFLAIEKTPETTDSLDEYKVIEAVNYKCSYCAKKYNSENGVRKHLNENHDTKDPLLAQDYSSFVGVKMSKVSTFSLSQSMTMNKSEAVTFSKKRNDNFKCLHI